MASVIDLLESRSDLSGIEIRLNLAMSWSRDFPRQAFTLEDYVDGKQSLGDLLKAEPNHAVLLWLDEWISSLSATWCAANGRPVKTEFKHLGVIHPDGAAAEPPTPPTPVAEMPISSENFLTITARRAGKTPVGSRGLESRSIKSAATMAARFTASLNAHPDVELAPARYAKRKDIILYYGPAMPVTTIGGGVDADIVELADGKWRCTGCGGGFETKTLVQRHVVKHKSGELECPFVEECQSKTLFFRWDKFRDHMKKYHAEVPLTDPTVVHVYMNYLHRGERIQIGKLGYNRTCGPKKRKAPDIVDESHLAKKVSTRAEPKHTDKDFDTPDAPVAKKSDNSLTAEEQARMEANDRLLAVALATNKILTRAQAAAMRSASFSRPSAPLGSRDAEMAKPNIENDTPGDEPHINNCDKFSEAAAGSASEIVTITRADEIAPVKDRERTAAEKHLISGLSTCINGKTKIAASANGSAVATSTKERERESEITHTDADIPVYALPDEPSGHSGLTPVHQSALRNWGVQLSAKNEATFAKSREDETAKIVNNIIALAAKNSTEGSSSKEKRHHRLTLQGYTERRSALAMKDTNSQGEEQPRVGRIAEEGWGRL